jgi:hypothetical protein
MTDFTTLQESLLKAKRVMSAVGDVSPSKPNINRTPELPNHVEPIPSLPPRSVPSMGGSPELQEAKRVGNLEAMSKKPTSDKIQSSKLPDAIKKLMVEHPIPEINFQNSLPDELIENVSKKMKKLGDLPASSVDNNIRGTQPSKSNIKSNNKIKSSDLKNIIRQTIIETIDDLVDERISERLSESNVSKESIQLVVGNTVFKGNITSTKKLS